MMENKVFNDNCSVTITDPVRKYLMQANGNLRKGR